MSLERAQADIESIAARLEQEDPGPQKGRGIRVQPLESATVREPPAHPGCAAGRRRLRPPDRVRERRGTAPRSRDRAAEGGRHQACARRELEANRSALPDREPDSLGVGALLGVALAWFSLRAIVAAAPQWLSNVQHIELDSTVLLFTVVVSMVTALLFGLVPMLSVSTQSLVMPLKAARAVSGGRGHRRVQGALVVAQVTLTLVLLVGAGLLIKSFWQLQRVNLGLDSNRVVWFQTRVPANKGFRQVGNQNGMVALDVSPIPGQLFDRLRDRLREIPGVESVGGPMRGSCPVRRYRRRSGSTGDRWKEELTRRPASQREQPIRS